MIVTANMSKNAKAIRTIMDYAQELVKEMWPGKKPAAGLGPKLATAPAFFNFPKAVNPVDYVVGLSLLTRARCNPFLSLVASQPDGVVWSPNQYALFNHRFLHHLSSTAFVKRPKAGGDKRPDRERFVKVDIERELAHYFVLQNNTNNQHEHAGICMVHPDYRRIVDINGGHFKIAILYSTYAALKDLGYELVNPYALGTHRDRAIIALATHFRKDGLLKSWKQLRAEGLVEKVWGTLKHNADELMARAGIGQPAGVEPGVIKTTKAEAIRGQANVAREISSIFPEGSACLTGDPEQNRRWLDDRLKKVNAGLKVGRHGGLVFCVDGLHEAASATDPVVASPWRREQVEKLCGLRGNWSLGKSVQAQSKFLRDQEQRSFRLACARLNQQPDYSTMCRFLDALPRQWRQVTVDVLKSDQDWDRVGTLEVGFGNSVENTPGLLELAHMTTNDKFPIGMVFVTPVLPAGQLPLYLYHVPGSELDRLRGDLAPAMVVQMDHDEYAAMILIEDLPEGRWQTHNARSRLGHEFAKEYHCDYAIYGIPLPGLPLFPHPFVAKLVGQPHAFTSLTVQTRLVATWENLKAEEMRWWKNLRPTIASLLAAEIAQEFAQVSVPMFEVLPTAIAQAEGLWQAPQPMNPPQYGAPPEQGAHSPAKRKMEPTAEPVEPSRCEPIIAPNSEHKQTIADINADHELVEPAPVPEAPSPSQPAPIDARQPKPQTKAIQSPLGIKKEPETRTATPSSPARPDAGMDDQEQKKKRHARQMALLAGFFQIGGKTDRLEALVEKEDLGLLQPAIFARVWHGLMAQEDKTRFKSLLAFMTRKSEVEPDWLEQAEVQAELEVLANLEAANQPRGKIKRGEYAR